MASWRICLASFVLLIGWLAARGQGCSDAGFCSAGALQSAFHKTDSASDRFTVGIAGATGAGEQGTAISQLQLELSARAGKKSALQLNLPFTWVQGKIGTFSGVGDVLVSISRPLLEQSNWVVIGSLGSKVSTGTAETKKYGLSLPMPYQVNLGTTDLIAGVNIAYRNWLKTAIGLQQPLVQYNNNGFITSNYQTAEPTIYFSSRQLRRRGDVLLRVEGVRQMRKWRVAAGPLFIYHLGQDGITTATGEKVRLAGSEGLTVNLTASVQRAVQRMYIEAIFGTPVVVRSYRPDGLTRAWVLTCKVSRKYR
jgi:hypothetical protein